MPIDIIKEPRGAAYGQLVDRAVAQCATFSLTWRDGEACDPQVAESLQLFLAREERTSAWPGTSLAEGQLATVRHYELTNVSGAILKRANSLYAWQHPSGPEDLAFYTEGGRVWLGSIAHESDAWLDERDVAVTDIAQTMPLLEVEMRNDGSSPSAA
jgi:hypothetical protein